jgi:hypothetical protein
VLATARVSGALLAPLVAAYPQQADLLDGLAEATSAHYAENFAVRPAAFDEPEMVSDPHRWVRPYLQDVHEVRYGRASAAARAENGSSILGRAATGGDAEVIGALLEAAGWDLPAVAAETPEEALWHEEARGLFPVHRGALQKLATEAAAPRRSRAG